MINDKQTGKKMQVHGIAIRPGVSKNGINYTEEALMEFAPTLAGKPILKDHVGIVDNVVGIVENAQYSMNSVPYTGWVKEDGTGLLEKIKDGRIKEVSIGGFARRLVKNSDDDETLTAVGLEAMELSLTPTPAVKGTSLQQTLKMMAEKVNDKRVHVLPVLESTRTFQPYVMVKNNTNLIAESDNKKDKEESIMAENKTPEVTEAAKVSENKGEPAQANVAIKVDSSQVDEAIKKQERLLELKQKNLEADAKLAAQEAAKKIEDQAVAEEKKTELKGKVAQTNTASVEQSSQFVVESSEFGDGNALWRMPKANGSLI